MMYDDELKVPEFMDRQEFPIAQEERKTVFGTIRNICESAIAKAKKRNLRKRKVDAPALIVSFALGAALTLGGVKMVDTFTPDEPQPSIPNGYILTEITDRVESGDTITGIANEYYNANTYAGMYSTPIDYKNAILEQNNLKDYTTIRPGDSIAIPVVVNINNEFFVRIQVIKDTIKQIEAEDLWVDYILQSGEGILSLAAKASGSVNETYQIADKIKERNRNANFWYGETVSIMNPQLGQLKTELKELEQALQESLKVNEKLENNKTR